MGERIAKRTPGRLLLGCLVALAGLVHAAPTGAPDELDGSGPGMSRREANRLPVALTRAQKPAAARPAVRYVANAGMRLDLDGARFLVDAPIREGIAPYATSSPEERAQLEGAVGPYAGVDAVLITHWHEDHFSAEAVAALLANSSRTLLVSAPEVVERVRALSPGLPQHRVRAVLPAPGGSERIDVGGVPVHVLRLRHNPTRRLPEQHVGFLVGAAAPVLHVGDADPKADNFAVLRALPPVDVAFLPFWYVSGEANRRLVATAIRPKRIVAMHAPPADAVQIAAALRAATVDAVVAAVPGSALTVPE